MKKPDVAIGIACQEFMHSRTAASISFNIINSGVVSDVYMRQGSDITSARTWIVQKALDEGKTHLLFVDSDMVFPPDTLQRLLDHKKAIVGTEYFMRKFPKTPTFKPLDPEKAVGMYKADYCGTGLLLIDLKIFESMTKPWFLFGRGSDGQPVIGEDAWFCKTARDNGHDVWIDAQVPVGHLGYFQF